MKTSKQMKEFTFWKNIKSSTSLQAESVFFISELNYYYFFKLFIFTLLPSPQMDVGGQGRPGSSWRQYSPVQGLLSRESVCWHRLLKCEILPPWSVIDLHLRTDRLLFYSLLCFDLNIDAFFSFLH